MYQVKTCDFSSLDGSLNRRQYLGRFWVFSFTTLEYPVVARSGRDYALSGRGTFVIYGLFYTSTFETRGAAAVAVYFVKNTTAAVFLRVQLAGAAGGSPLADHEELAQDLTALALIAVARLSTFVSYFCLKNVGIW